MPEWVSGHLDKLGVIYDAVSKTLKLSALHRKKIFDLKRCTGLHFQPGDSVLLLKGAVVDKNITKREWATEGPFEGPFTVHRALGKGNYQLRDMKTRRLHDEVHVDRLVPYPKGHSAEDIERYPIKSIVGRRIAKLESADRALSLPKGTPVLQYKVRWQGHPGFTDTWRAAEYLADVKEFTDAYDRRVGIITPQTAKAHSRDAAI